MFTSNLNNITIEEINNDVTINGNLKAININCDQLTTNKLIFSEVVDINTTNVTATNINATKLNNLNIGSHVAAHNKSIVHTGRTLEDESSDNKAVETALGIAYNPAILFPLSFLPSSINPIQLVHTKHLDESLLTKSLFINGQIGLNIEELNNLGSSIISSIGSGILSQLTDGTININVNAFLNNTSTNTLQLRNLSNLITSSALSKITARDSNNNIINNIHYLAPNLFITTDAQGYLINPLNAPFNNFDEWKSWKQGKDAEKILNDLKNTEQDARLTTREAKDGLQDIELVRLETIKLDKPVFDALELKMTEYFSANTAKDILQEEEITSLELRKLDKTIYNADRQNWDLIRNLFPFALSGDIWRRTGVLYLDENGMIRTTSWPSYDIFRLFDDRIGQLMDGQILNRVLGLVGLGVGVATIGGELTSWLSGGAQTIVKDIPKEISDVADLANTSKALADTAKSTADAANSTASFAQTVANAASNVANVLKSAFNVESSQVRYSPLESSEPPQFADNFTFFQNAKVTKAPDNTLPASAGDLKFSAQGLRHTPTLDEKTSETLFQESNPAYILIEGGKYKNNQSLHGGIHFFTNNQMRMQVKESGSIKIGNIEDIEATIASLQSSTFDYNNYYNKSEIDFKTRQLQGVPHQGSQGYAITWNESPSGQTKQNTIKLETTGQDEYIAVQSWVLNELNSYYNKNYIDSTFNNFYTKSETDNLIIINYYDKLYIDEFFYNKTQIQNLNYVNTTSLNDALNTLHTTIQDNFYTKSEANENFYFKSEVDSTINNSLSQYYNKQETENTFYSKTSANNTFYKKNQDLNIGENILYFVNAQHKIRNYNKYNTGHILEYQSMQHEFRGTDGNYTDVYVRDVVLNNNSLTTRLNTIESDVSYVSNDLATNYYTISNINSFNFVNSTNLNNSLSQYYTKNQVDSFNFINSTNLNNSLSQYYTKTQIDSFDYINSTTLNNSITTVNTNLSILSSELTNNYVNVFGAQFINGTKTFTNKIVCMNGDEASLTLSNNITGYGGFASPFVDFLGGYNTDSTPFYNIESYARKAGPPLINCRLSFNRNRGYPIDMYGLTNFFKSVNIKDGLYLSLGNNFNDSMTLSYNSNKSYFDVGTYGLEIRRNDGTGNLTNIINIESTNTMTIFQNTKVLGKTLQLESANNYDGTNNIIFAHNDVSDFTRIKQYTKLDSTSGNAVMAFRFMKPSDHTVTTSDTLCFSNNQVGNNAKLGVGVNIPETTIHLKDVNPTIRFESTFMNSSFQIQAFNSFLYFFRFNGSNYSVISHIDDDGDYIKDSDLNLKKNIEKLNNNKSLQKVLNARTVHYQFKSSEREKIKIGLIAQEELKNNPDCVSAVYIPEQKINHLAINYDDYIIHLIGAVQEIYKRISYSEVKPSIIVKNSELTNTNELLERIEALEKKNHELESMLNDQQKAINTMKKALKEIKKV